MVDYLTQPQALRDTFFGLNKNVGQLLGDSASLSAGINRIDNTIDLLQTNGVRFGIVLAAITPATDMSNPGSGTVQLYSRQNPLELEPGETPVHNHYYAGYGIGTTIAVISFAGSFFAIAGENSVITPYYTTGSLTVARPTNAVSLNFILIGGGGGGGSGNKQTAGNSGHGGGGGGGGGLSTLPAPVPASVFPASFKLWTGAGGAGGSAVTATVNTDGNNGVDGSPSRLTTTADVDILVANGGAKGLGDTNGGTGTTAGGAGGAGGTGTFNGGAGSAGSGGDFNPVDAAAVTIDAIGFSGGAGGGGGAGRAASGSNSRTGAAGGYQLYSSLVFVYNGVGGIGVNVGAPGGNSGVNNLGGAGGGGGGAIGPAANTAGTTTGGLGGLWGGGGGGGGGGQFNAGPVDIRNGGAGGHGGQGLAIMIVNY